MANEDLAALQREALKHQAALACASEKIRVIEGEQKRQREERERKQRELVSLQRKQEACKGWIAQQEKEISELRELAARQVEVVCEGSGEVWMHWKNTLQNLAAAELELAALKAFADSIPGKIEVLQKACARPHAPG